MGGAAPTLHDISREEIMPRLRSVLSRAGYPGLLGGVSPEILRAAKAVYAAALDIASPRARSWRLKKCDVAPSLIPPKFENASSCTLLLVTLGHELDEEVAARFAAGAPLEAALMDAWGSEAAETLAENLDRRLRRETKAGERGTNRFAPGYNGFDVRNNAKWLGLVSAGDQDNLAGVAADPETGILSPRKSVLCMIGWEAPL